METGATVISTFQLIAYGVEKSILPINVALEKLGIFSFSVARTREIIVSVFPSPLMSRRISRVSTDAECRIYHGITNQGTFPQGGRNLLGGLGRNLKCSLRDRVLPKPSFRLTIKIEALGSS